MPSFSTSERENEATVEILFSNKKITKGYLAFTPMSMGEEILKNYLNGKETLFILLHGKPEYITPACGRRNKTLMVKPALPKVLVPRR